MIAGITGAMETITGTPASASVRTAASPFAAIGASRSTSRTTRSDLVVMVSGCEHSASTSTMLRVIRHVASIG